MSGDEGLEGHNYIGHGYVGGFALECLGPCLASGHTTHHSHGRQASFPGQDLEVEEGVSEGPWNHILVFGEFWASWHTAHGRHGAASPGNC